MYVVKGWQDMTRTKIDDDDLDRLLDRAATTPPHNARVDAAVAALLTEVRGHVPPRRRRGPRLMTVAVGLAIAGALVAGTTMSAVWLQIPPFQELPEGWSRTTEYIPLEWVSVAGEEERCRVYLELERARPGDIDALDAAIAARDWTGFGQDLYDSLPDAPIGPDGEGEVHIAAVPLIQAFAVSVIPEVGEIGAASDDGPAVGAIATTCRTDI
jgi:hypothetical protein